MKRMSGSKKVFVTVGTTSFDKLITTMCDNSAVKMLIQKKYSQMILQIGRGEYEPPSTSTARGLDITFYRYKSSLSDDIESADLVISHAGAGTCMEVLAAKKPLLVVINEDLMDNHQIELASQLHQDGHVFYCTCSTLEDTLRQMDLSSLKSFPRGQPEKFAAFLDSVMGFDKVDQPRTRQHKSEVYQCIECGQEAPELYHTYGDGIIKVMHCTSCKQAVDKYIEYDPVIVCLDALLHKTQVYRHLLFNSHIPALWKLMLVYLLCDTYIQWQHIETRRTRPVIEDHIFYAALEWDIYVIFLVKCFEWFVLVSSMLLLLIFYRLVMRTGDAVPAKFNLASIMFAHRLLVLSSFAKLLAIPAVIWAQTHSTIYLLLTQVLVFTSNVAALKVSPGMNTISSSFILLVIHLLQYFTGMTFIRFLYPECRPVLQPCYALADVEQLTCPVYQYDRLFNMC